MRAALLALLVALPALAEPREVLEVRKGTIELVDGRALEVSGGAYLSGPSLVATAKELSELRAENEQLRVAPVVAPASIAVAGVVGIALGLVLGLVLARR